MGGAFSELQPATVLIIKFLRKQKWQPFPTTSQFVRIFYILSWGFGWLLRQNKQLEDINAMGIFQFMTFYKLAIHKSMALMR